MNEITSDGTGSHDAAVTELPPELESLERDIVAAGGEWQPPEEYAGSVARTMFDMPSSDDGTVTILLPKENLEDLPAQAMVRIRSVQDGRSYLGVVVKGPFAEPDGLRADSTPLVAVTVKGGILMPRFHGRAQVSILSEELPDRTAVPPRRRPLPNSPVFVLDAVETGAVLKTGGDLCIGVLEGNDSIEIRTSTKAKSVLPRHLGILGTTGGGKSTTVSGLVSQLQQSGVATILFDTEGEYTSICDATNQEEMVKALQRRGREARGVPNTHVYVLTGRVTRNPKHPSIKTFRLDFAEISPFAFAEILDLSDAQEHRFFQAFDVCKAVLRELKIYPASKEEESEAFEVDEQETGYPRMTLAHLIDIASLCLAVVGNKKDDARVRSSEFKGKEQQLCTKIEAANVERNEISWRALLARLWKIDRLRIFDSMSASSVNYAELLQAGEVSIIDLSDTDSPTINNLVIAQLLKGVQRQQDSNYQAAVTNDKTPTPTMVLIEEAHEFLSAQRIKSMPTLFQNVARIARRGRKRWLGLGFITQLPQHLPDEVLGLINNWILHKVSDTGVVNRLRKSVGGVDEGLWARLPALAPGQAIVSLSTLARPVLVSVDPTPCRLLMAD